MTTSNDEPARETHQVRRAEGKCVHVFRCSGEDLARAARRERCHPPTTSTVCRTLPPSASAAHWASASHGACLSTNAGRCENNAGPTSLTAWTPHRDNGNAHEGEQRLAVLLVLLRHVHGTLAVTVYVLHLAVLLGGFHIFLCLLLGRLTLLQLISRISRHA